MEIISCLPGLRMTSTTYLHRLTLLCTKLSQVHSQQERLKIILKEQLKGLLPVIVHFHFELS